MILTLCHREDAAALWLHGELLRLGVSGLEIVGVDQLVYSRKIVHCLDNAGDTGAIHLADGRVLRPETISGLINRVRYLPARHLERAGSLDRSYALEELNALILAWLDGIAGPVINPARPFALGGAAFPTATLIQAAATAGLPTAPWRADAENGEPDMAAVPPAAHANIVFAGRVFGPLLPRSLQDACRRLATLLGLPLLQVELSRAAPAGWRFARAHGEADFRIGGRSLVRAVAEALGTKAVTA